jgi:hypothetical protein
MQEVEVRPPRQRSAGPSANAACPEPRYPIILSSCLRAVNVDRGAILVGSELPPRLGDRDDLEKLAPLSSAVGLRDSVAVMQAVNPMRPQSGDMMGSRPRPSPSGSRIRTNGVLWHTPAAHLPRSLLCAGHARRARWPANTRIGPRS